MAEAIAGYPAGWHTWRRAVQTPSHSFKAGSQVKAADTPLWTSSDLRDEVVESKVELKAAVESMKGDLLKEFATILKAQAEEHSKALAQVQVTKAETRTAGARRAAGVYSGQGTNASSVTALTAEPPELGQEGEFEIFNFKEAPKEVSPTKKRSTQTPPLQIPEEFILEKFEEGPLILAWVDALVDGNAEKHDQIDAAYLRDTVAGGTLGNVNVGMNAVLCFLKNGLMDEPQQHTLTVLSTLLGIDYENEYDRADRIAMMNDVGERLHR